MSPVISAMQAPASQRSGTPQAAELPRRIFKVPDSLRSKLAKIAPAAGLDTDAQPQVQPTVQAQSNVEQGSPALDQATTATNCRGFCDDVGKPLPGTNLKYFNRPIPPRSANDFKDIKGHFAGPLYDAIAKKRKVIGDIEMKLKHLGLTESCVELYIIVLCEKKSARIARKFFDQPHIFEVIRQCHFQLLVLDAQLMRLADEDAFQVFTSKKPQTTWCGTSITIYHDGELSGSATMGGIVMIEGQASRRWIYGLTTSHILDKLRPASLPLPEDLESSSDSNSDSDSDCSLDAVQSGHVQSTPEHNSEKRRNNRDIAITLQSLDPVGSIAFDSVEPNNNPGLDWALISLAKAESLPNMISREAQQQIPSLAQQDSNSSSPHDQTEYISLVAADESIYEDYLYLPVSVYTSRGHKSASLSFNGSSILIASGHQFVDIYDLSMSPNSELQQGDSGSWVLDQSTGHVYGLVVSFDVFGDVQVMPINAVLSGIKNTLQAAHVFLPSAEQLDQWREAQREFEPTIAWHDDKSRFSDVSIPDEELDYAPSTHDDTADSYHTLKYWRPRNASQASFSSRHTEATAITAPSISSHDNDQTMVAIPCEFKQYTSCPMTFHSISAFMQHSLDHHTYPLPKTSLCLHCDTWIFDNPSDSPVLRQHYFLARLQHIGEHYLHEDPGPVRPDHFILKHLRDNGTISNEQWKKLNTNESGNLEKFWHGVLKTPRPSKSQYTEEIAGREGRGRRGAKQRREAEPDEGISVGSKRSISMRSGGVGTEAAASPSLRPITRS